MAVFQGLIGIAGLIVAGLGHQREPPGFFMANARTGVGGTSTTGFALDQAGRPVY